MVDLDPQSDVSTGMDIPVAGHLNVADVLASPKEKIVRSAITSSGWAKGHPGTIDVMIGSPSAINFDGPHPSVRDIWKLEEALAHVERDYDLVLIDCAPSLNALTRTAWAASDRVIVVTEPGLFSVAAADRALRAIEEIRRGLSPRLQPLGIIVNRARVQSIEHQFRIKELRDMFGPLVLSPQLPERTSLQQAQGAAKPLHIWPGDCAQEMAPNFDALLDRVMRTAKLTHEGQLDESRCSRATSRPSRATCRSSRRTHRAADQPRSSTQPQEQPQQPLFPGFPGFGQDSQQPQYQQRLRSSSTDTVAAAALAAARSTHGQPQYSQQPQYAADAVVAAAAVRHRAASGGLAARSSSSQRRRPRPSSRTGGSRKVRSARAALNA